MNYRGKRDWGPEEKIGPEKGIEHWTLGSARALFMEDDIGSVEAGKYGDLVLWNYNPLKFGSWWSLLTHDLEPGALDDFVDLTVVDGRIVYQKTGSRL